MSLLSLFDFLDSSGSPTAQDSAGVAQNATFFGDAATDGAGNAIFDGDGDYAVLDADPAFDLNRGTIEVSFTLASPSPGNNPWGSNAAYTVFSTDATGTTEGHLSIYIRSNGEIWVRHQTDGQHHYYSGGTATVGTEVDVSYSFGPSGSVLVVDGVTVDTGTIAHTMTGGTNPIVIGASTATASTGVVNTTAGHFDGTMSRVAIYNDQVGSRGAPLCLASGTQIATPMGLRPAETLGPGDKVFTLDQGVVPIMHVVRQAIRAPRLRRHAESRPIRIASGALGNDAPLSLSRQHCVLMHLDDRQVLVRSGHLADFGPGQFRRADGVRRVSYVHLLLPRHDLICADGCWVESLLPSSQAVPICVHRHRQVSESLPCRPILTGRQVRDSLGEGRLSAPSIGQLTA